MTETPPEAPTPSTDATPDAPPSTGPSETITALADEIAGVDAPTGADNRPTDGAVLRYGKITAVGTGVNLGKAQTDTTGDYWNPVDNSYLPVVGDLVYLFQQGPVSHIGGRLGGSPSAPPVGVIWPFGGTTPPTGWLMCDGSAVSRTQYAELFAILGTKFGAGNGSSTFNLPNGTDRILVGAGSKFLWGETGGSELVSLTTSNLPSHSHSHSHTVNPGSHTHTISGDSHTHPMSHDHSGGTHSHSMGHDHTSSSHSHSVGGGGGSVMVPGAPDEVSVARSTAQSTGSASVNINAYSGSTGSASSNVSAYSGSTGSGGNMSIGSTDLPVYTSDTDNTATGGGSAFNNMPPYLTVGGYIVRATR